MNPIKSFRDRKFCLVLYPKEDETHANAIEIIKKNFYSYAQITHDKDLDEEGNLLKQHDHIVLSFSNARFNTAIAEELGIALNYIEQCRTFKNALQYLVHYNEEDKYQYDIESVKGDLKKKLEKMLNNDGKEEYEKIADIYQWIADCCCYVNIAALQRYCMSNGTWDTLRRNYSLVKDYLNANNEQYLSKSYEEN